MSTFWSIFVIAGTVLSLAAMLWLLVSNRQTSGEETTGHEWDGIQELDSPLPMWWVWMFVITIVFAVAYLVIYPGLGNVDGAVGWTSAGEHDQQVAAHNERFAPLYARLAELPPEALLEDRQAQQVGRRLFLNNCSLCHGVAGTGAFGFPDLTDSEWIWGGDFAQIKHSIQHGRQAVMPGWGAVLGDSGSVEVANYVLQLAGKDHDAELAAKGVAQYNGICVACHGAEGKGNVALGTPDLTNDLWLYGDSLGEIVFTIQHGRNGVMPAFDEVLGEDRVHILSGYVQSLSQ